MTRLHPGFVLARLSPCDALLVIHFEHSVESVLVSGSRQ
jgi:hypothetical protein